MEANLSRTHILVQICHIFLFSWSWFLYEYFDNLQFNPSCWLRPFDYNLKKYKLTIDVKATPNEKAVACRSKPNAIPGRRERAFIELRRSKPVSNLGSNHFSWETTGSSKDKHREFLRRHSSHGSKILVVTSGQQNNNHMTSEPIKKFKLVVQSFFKKNRICARGPSERCFRPAKLGWPIGPRSGQTQIVGWAGRSYLTKNVMGTMKILPAEILIVKIVDNSSRDEEIDEQLH